MSSGPLPPESQPGAAQALPARFAYARPGSSADVLSATSFFRSGRESGSAVRTYDRPATTMVWGRTLS